MEFSNLDLSAVAFFIFAFTCVWNSVSVFCFCFCFFFKLSKYIMRQFRGIIFNAVHDRKICNFYSWFLDKTILKWDLKYFSVSYNPSCFDYVLDAMLYNWEQRCVILRFARLQSSLCERTIFFLSNSCLFLCILIFCLPFKMFRYMTPDCFGTVICFFYYFGKSSFLSCVQWTYTGKQIKYQLFLLK